MVFWLHPCGIVCILFTYAIVAYSDYVVIFHLIRPVLQSSILAIVNVVGFNLVIFLLVTAHLCAVMTDPGLVPMDEHPVSRYGPNKTLPPGWMMCKKCQIFRPPRAYHCRMCKRCVLRMDHHCPWVNNCVGEHNQKYFIQFLVYVGILCIYSVGLIILCRAVMAAPSSPDADAEGSSSSVNNISVENNNEMFGHHRNETDPLIVIHTISLAAISGLFGLFVLAVLSDQYKSIVDDQTAVEAIKMRYRPDDREQGGYIPRSMSKRKLFEHVFGRGPCIFWLLPFTYLFQPTPCSSHHSSNHEAAWSNFDNPPTSPSGSTIHLHHHKAGSNQYHIISSSTVPTTTTTTTAYDDTATTSMTVNEIEGDLSSGTASTNSSVVVFR